MMLSPSSFTTVRSCIIQLLPISDSDVDFVSSVKKGARLPMAEGQIESTSQFFTLKLTKYHSNRLFKTHLYTIIIDGCNNKNRCTAVVLIGNVGGVEVTTCWYYLLLTTYSLFWNFGSWARNSECGGRLFSPSDWQKIDTYIYIYIMPW